MKDMNNTVKIAEAKTTLVKGTHKYHDNRFILYKIPYEEWYANAYFRFKSKDYISDNVYPEDDVYILRDKSQEYNQQYFIRYPYQNEFIQLYEHGSIYGQFCEQFGEERVFTVGTIVEQNYTLPYNYYSKEQVIIRNNKICFCGDCGSFSVGCDVYWSDDVIEKFLSNYEFVMFSSNQKIMRTAFNTVSNETLIYTTSDIDYTEEHLYIINESTKEYRESEVKSCEMYRDGGTTNIKYIDNDVEYELHLDTPFHSPQVHTLNNIPCIKSIDKDEYDGLYEKFYNIVGFKLLKL